MSFSFYLLAPIFISSWLIARVVCHRAASLRLVQLPNGRSSHKDITPHGGGLGFVLVATLFSFFGGLESYSVLFCLASILAALGLWDDIRHVPAWLRFIIQATVMVLFLSWLGYLPALHFHGLELDGWPLMIAVGIVGLWWVNLFNFMDGIDGIACVQAVSTLLLALILMTTSGRAWLEAPLLQVMLVVVAAVAGFLVVNWPPARIFMGDTGSTWLAFIILALALFSVKQDWLAYSVWMILTSLFVLDASITLFTRLLRGHKFYEAHRCHAYQKLARRFQQRFTLRMGEREARARAHLKVSLLVVVVNVMWLFPLAWLSMNTVEWGIWFVFLAWLPLCIVIIRVGAGRPDTV
ncbi:MAG: glycosyl transferase family 4 [Ketobacter sp.]|nr:MAG: glycosyl transferase family 4 [Ketobacter sp.]